ncbi:hypothetical protein CALVIDRAFT_565710 [Calocera viscosa TUFC12733]|uniref:Uncharacterized protein n=1 Tax=Calocera viscosa (strain TUFC12733) TaxID=1330018 RepID=A0A167K7E6_CALVF|nr:hypothetical protein CALVIDRAFT_565710 [Calocera viscosa TUFC12733]
MSPGYVFKRNEGELDIFISFRAAQDSTNATDTGDGSTSLITYHAVLTLDAFNTRNKLEHSVVPIASDGQWVCFSQYEEHSLAHVRLIDQSDTRVVPLEMTVLHGKTSGYFTSQQLYLVSDELPDVQGFDIHKIKNWSIGEPAIPSTVTMGLEAIPLENKVFTSAKFGWTMAMWQQDSIKLYRESPDRRTGPVLWTSIEMQHDYFVSDFCVSMEHNILLILSHRKNSKEPTTIRMVTLPAESGSDSPSEEWIITELDSRDILRHCNFIAVSSKEKVILMTRTEGCWYARLECIKSSESRIAPPILSLGPESFPKYDLDRVTAVPSLEAVQPALMSPVVSVMEDDLPEDFLAGEELETVESDWLVHPLGGASVHRIAYGISLDVTLLMAHVDGQTTHFIGAATTSRSTVRYYAMAVYERYSKDLSQRYICYWSDKSWYQAWIRLVRRSAIGRLPDVDRLHQAIAEHDDYSILKDVTADTTERQLAALRLGL